MVASFFNFNKTGVLGYNKTSVNKYFNLIYV
jgi:hypothetical protein